MRWPWSKKTEEKGGGLVQYQGGVYFIGNPSANADRLKDFVQGYRVCDTVYSCVNLIAQSAVLVPWYVYREKADGDVEEVDRHPLAEWMDKPGPGLDWTEFLTRCFSFYLTLGNCYIRKNIGGFGTKALVEVLRAQNVKIKPDSMERPVAYEYRLGKNAAVITSYPADQIIHVKTFNPEDALYGLAPINVLARKIDISHFGELWTLALLENDARPSGLLTVPGVTADQQARLTQMIKDQFSGYENAGMPMVGAGDWKWQQFSFTPKELEFLHSKRATMREICAAYKVAPELFGDSENKTYSNIKEARKALYQEAVIPLLGKFKNAFNEQIVPFFDKSEGLFLDYDVSGIDALSEDLGALWTRVHQFATSGLITRGEAREEIGYGELDGEDAMLAPISTVETLVSELGKPKPEPKPMPKPAVDEDDEGEEEDEDEKPPKSGPVIATKADSFWHKPERKEAKLKAFERRVMAQEKSLGVIAQKYLREQADRIAASVKKVTTIQQLNEWGLMDDEDEAQRYLKATLAWYASTFKLGLNSGLAASKGEIFVEGDVKDDIGWGSFEEVVRKMIVESGTKIAATTMEEVMALLAMAREEMWTVALFAQVINDKLFKKAPYRSRLIARTESVKIHTFGELEGYKQTEFIRYKSWMCSFVEDSREAHKSADGQIRRLDEPFDIDGKAMMHPGDPNGGPGNVCNCLCDIAPEIAPPEEV